MAVKKLFTRITSSRRKGLSVCFRNRVDRRFIPCFYSDFYSKWGERKEKTLPLRARRIVGNKQVVWLNSVWWQVTGGSSKENIFRFALMHPHVHKKRGRKPSVTIRDRGPRR